jgi:hypothetical protein
MGKTIFRCHQNKTTMKKKTVSIPEEMILLNRAAVAYQKAMNFAPVQPAAEIPYVYQLMLDELQAIRKLLAVIASPPEKAYNGPG